MPKEALSTWIRLPKMDPDPEGHGIRIRIRNTIQRDRNILYIFFSTLRTLLLAGFFVDLGKLMPFRIRNTAF